ncbi:MAG: hypothetical protein WKF78_07720 [Candidatus Limnocylindrales bacterium]
MKPGGSVPVDVVPVPDLHDEQLAALDIFLDGVRAGAFGQALGGVDLGVEDERASAEQAFGIDDPARLLVDRQPVGVLRRARSKERRVEAGDDAEGAIVDPVGDDAGRRGCYRPGPPA